jgi:hypothetical protein
MAAALYVSFSLSIAAAASAAAAVLKRHLAAF